MSLNLPMLGLSQKCISEAIDPPLPSKSAIKDEYLKISAIGGVIFAYSINVTSSVFIYPCSRFEWMQVLSMEITKTAVFRTSLMILNLSADRDERLVNQQHQFGQASRNGKS